MPGVSCTHPPIPAARGRKSPPPVAIGRVVRIPRRPGGKTGTLAPLSVNGTPLAAISEPYSWPSMWVSESVSPRRRLLPFKRLCKSSDSKRRPEQPHPVAAFGLEALHPRLLGQVDLAQLAPDATQHGRFGIVAVGDDGAGDVGTFLHQGFNILTQESPVASGGAINGQTAPVGPLPQGRVVDPQSPADCPQGHPPGFICGVGSHENLYKSLYSAKCCGFRGRILS